MRRYGSTLLAMAIALSMGASGPQVPTAGPVPATPPPFAGELSVMTYNVHGLPWPVAWGRPAQLVQIAATLRDLRAHGRNPHIVVLQEAFTRDAQSIGQASGYRYVVNGPSSDMPGSAQPDGAGRLFARAGSWLKGEGLGKYVGSGLQILSDYPVVGVRRFAFPAFACAGYDCLANKGALMASIKLPDRADPVDIVTTHLNSRHASGVSNDRSLQAYREQVGYLTMFIRAAHDPSRALIVAGDFNVGLTAQRREALLAPVLTRWSPASQPMDDAYGAAHRTGIALSPDARFSHRRARDWEFYAPGTQSMIALHRIDVPFGHAPDGSMLSDHVGYTAIFDLSRAISRTRPSTSFARSKASVSGGAPA